MTREELKRLREPCEKAGSSPPRPRSEVAKELRQVMAEITDHIALIAEVERLTARVAEAEEFVRAFELRATRCVDCRALREAYPIAVLHHAPDCALAKWLEGK